MNADNKEQLQAEESKETAVLFNFSLEIDAVSAQVTACELRFLYKDNFLKSILIITSVYKITITTFL